MNWCLGIGESIPISIRLAALIYARSIKSFIMNSFIRSIDCSVLENNWIVNHPTWSNLTRFVSFEMKNYVGKVADQVQFYMFGLETFFLVKFCELTSQNRKKMPPVTQFGIFSVIKITNYTLSLYVELEHFGGQYLVRWRHKAARSLGKVDEWPLHSCKYDYDHWS